MLHELFIPTRRDSVKSFESRKTYANYRAGWPVEICRKISGGQGHSGQPIKLLVIFGFYRFRLKTKKTENDQIAHFRRRKRKRISVGFFGWWLDLSDPDPWPSPPSDFTTDLRHCILHHHHRVVQVNHCGAPWPMAISDLHSSKAFASSRTLLRQMLRGRAGGILQLAIAFLPP